jgi:hypothetical protein
VSSTSERIVCQINGYTVRVEGTEFGTLEHQALGEAEALVREYERKGYRRVTADYYDRRALRVALQGIE